MNPLRTRAFIALEKVLRATPGMSTEDLSLETGIPRATYRTMIAKLRDRPLGDPYRVRVKRYARVHTTGPQREFYEFHPTKRDAYKPKVATVAESCKKYRDKRKALLSVTRHGARSKLAQGGVHGMWAGLAA
jgi:hypothetical protein